MSGVTARAFFLERAQAPLLTRELALPAPGEHEAIVAVRACGLCHTDLGYADGSTAPKHALPLVLGHEVVGVVEQAGARFAHLVGKSVIVPAVLPCGGCELCKLGRGNACAKQLMPGNDVHGGFATHMLVPAAPLVSLEAAGDVLELAVVADAVSTAYQAVKRSGLREKELAVVVGAGGVGGYVIQIAAAVGARVVALDVDARRLEAMGSFGARERVALTGQSPKEVRARVGEIAKGLGIPSHHQRVFECSGHPDGQTLAFALLGRAGTLMQVGYTPQAVSVRLSNLMAFDATVHGTWGCPPELYPEVLRLIAEGRVHVTPFVERAPMSKLNTLLDDMAHHRLTKRMVLLPDF